MEKGPRRTKLAKIPVTLWSEIRLKGLRGESLAEIRDWLKLEHGIETTRKTVCVTIQRIRDELLDALPQPQPVQQAETIPFSPGLVPPPTGPDPLPEGIEPATDADELETMRRDMRAEMRHGDEWKQRHSAARLLLAVMAEQRAEKLRQLGGGDGAGAGAMSGGPKPQPTVLFDSSAQTPSPSA